MVSKQFEEVILKIIEEFLDRKHELVKLEKEKEYLLRLIADIEKAADNGSFDIQQVVSAIKQLRNQIETGQIHRAKIQPGLVREI